MESITPIRTPTLRSWWNLRSTRRAQRHALLLLEGEDCAPALLEGVLGEKVLVGRSALRDRLVDVALGGDITEVLAELGHHGLVHRADAGQKIRRRVGDRESASQLCASASDILGRLDAAPRSGALCGLKILRLLFE